MQRWLGLLLVVVSITLVTVPAQATNGDNLIGVGPVSRSMGGVGIAAPQDAIGAVFANPAAMCFGPYCPGSESVFAGTIFAPTVKATVTVMTPAGPMTMKDESQHPFFVIPAVGVTSPLSDRLRFAIGAYGVSGLGVDYRNSYWDLDGNPSNGFEGDVYTKLEIMKFAPNLAYLVTDNLAVGASLQLVYANLDLGDGSSHDYALGAQLGAIYNLGQVKVGAIFVTPEKATHERIANFDAALGDTTLDDLELESPMTLGAGVAYEPSRTFLIEGDVRWFNWADAAGYEDFDWEDQWVYALGVQYRPMERLALRAGFNYGKSPVKEHEGWDPMGMSAIQGKSTPTFGYEYLRIIGFPAVVEKHLTLGLGYQIADRLSLSLEYMHAFEEVIKETSAYGAVTLESSLEEDSYSFGMNWRF